MINKLSQSLELDLLYRRRLLAAGGLDALRLCGGGDLDLLELLLPLDTEPLRRGGCRLGDGDLLLGGAPLAPPLVGGDLERDLRGGGPLLLGGLRLFGGDRRRGPPLQLPPLSLFTSGFGSGCKTAFVVTSWPSIHPPSMCLLA